MPPNSSGELEPARSPPLPFFSSWFCTLSHSLDNFRIKKKVLIESNSLLARKHEVCVCVPGHFLQTEFFWTSPRGTLGQTHYPG